MVDSKGLITDTRGDELPEHKQEMARRDGVPDMKDLREIVEYVKPHALIGLSAAGPVWTEPIVQALCQGTESPLVFPLSNPTPKAEISAENAYSWSKGRCIFAGGEGPEGRVGGYVEVPEGRDLPVARALAGHGGPECGGVGR